MFIQEQMITYGECRQDFIDNEVMERHVWSPAACRHTCWTYRPNPYGKRLWGFIASV